MRVIGQTVGRCDATLGWGAVSVVDPEISGWPGVLLHLCAGALERYDGVDLFPREWLRVACRTGPHNRLVAGEVYSRFGEPFYGERGEAERLGRTRAERFPSAAEMARSARVAVRVAVVWDGMDLLAEEGLGSLREVINAHEPDAVYAGLDALAALRRRVGEIRDLCYVVVEQLVDRPRAEWIDAHWAAYGPSCLMTLVDLSLRVWGWREVEARAARALAGIPGERRRWRTAGWERLMREAPARERGRLRDAFLVGVPEKDVPEIVERLERAEE